MAETPDATPQGDATRAAVHATAASGGHDAQAAHGHDIHDDQGVDAPLGPLDAQAWGAGILGVATGGLVALLLYLVSYH